MIFLCFLFHIGVDIFESYMYRGIATSVTFCIILIREIIVHIYLTSAYMELFDDIYKLRHGKSDRIKRLEIYHVLQCITKQNPQLNSKVRYV